MTRERTRREFAAWNEEMVRRYPIDPYYERSHALIRWIERRRLDSLYALATARPGDRILEVGCGAGHVLARFGGFARVGLDLSPSMLAWAERRLGRQVRLVRGSAEDLPFGRAAFDVVLCTEVLEHTQHPERVIAELMRVAAPGSRVVISIPNERGIDSAKRFIRALPIARQLLGTLAAEGNEWHVHRFDKRLMNEVTSGVAVIARLKAVPLAAVPLRYVALLRHPASPRGEPRERV